MKEYVHEDFGPDEDTEELPAREYRKAYENGNLDFPDPELMNQNEIGLPALNQSTVSETNSISDSQQG